MIGYIESEIEKKRESHRKREGAWGRERPRTTKETDEFRLTPQ